MEPSLILVIVISCAVAVGSGLFAATQATKESKKDDEDKE